MALLLLSAALPAQAIGLRVGGGSTLTLGDGRLTLGCAGVTIAPGGTLKAETGTVRLAGDWSNQGTFDPGIGTVMFEDGCGPPDVSTVTGDNTFFDLVVTSTAGKTVKFQAGATQHVLHQLTLTGAPGHLLVVRSTEPGVQARLDLAPTGFQQIDYVDVADSAAVGQPLAPGPASVFHSRGSGNTTNWFVVAAAAIPALSDGGLVVMVGLMLAIGVVALRRTLPRTPAP